MSEPVISIIMAAHNEELFLPQTLKSLLRQTYRDFELICVNDASSDATAAILKNCDDPRLVVITNDHALGLTASLNKALMLARGRYIARADADDLYRPDRLALQLEFLECNPGYVAISSAATFIDEDGHVISAEQMPEDDLSIRWRCLFNSPFMHPAIMIRAEVLWKNNLKYNEGFKVAQDYELWSYLLEHGKGANLRERLYIRRDRKSSISRQRRTEQIEIRNWVSIRCLEKQFPGQHMNVDLIDRLRSIFINREVPPVRPTPADIVAYKDLFIRFTIMNADHPDLKTFYRSEILRQAKFFIRHLDLYAAFAFIRELCRIPQGEIAGSNMPDPLNFGGIQE
jgi:hypothetical protein